MEKSKLLVWSRYAGDTVMMGGTAMLYAMLTLVAAMLGMQLRTWLKGGVRHAAAFFHWLDELCYERLP